MKLNSNKEISMDDAEQMEWDNYIKWLARQNNASLKKVFNDAMPDIPSVGR